MASKKTNSYLVTGAVVLGIIAVGIKFREKIYDLGDKVGVPIREYLN